MPYIKNEDRKRFNKLFAELLDGLSVGELNFLITSICNRYLSFTGESYQTYNDIVGALECAKLEMYRRKIADYEDKKCWDNGDVYQ